MVSVGIVTLLLLNFFYSFVSSLYFHVEDSQRKCFTEELPDDTTLTGNFWTQLYDKQRDEYLPASLDLRTHVEAKDPDDKLVLSRSYGSKGRFRLTSLRPGGYQICLQSSSPQRPLPTGVLLTVHLDIRVGECTNNYTEIAIRDRLTELQLRVRQLSEQVQQIQKGLSYHRLMEKDFRQVTHSTNMWIFWWPVVRSLYVVFIIIWQTKSW